MPLLRHAPDDQWGNADDSSRKDPVVHSGEREASGLGRRGSDGPSENWSPSPDTGGLRARGGGVFPAGGSLDAGDRQFPPSGGGESLDRCFGWGLAANAGSRG